MKKVFLALALLYGSLSLAQIQKGDRIFAWQIDMTQNMNYDSAFNYASAGCLESIHFSSTWYDLETSLGNFNSTNITNRLDIANYYYPLKGIKVELQLAPMNTNVKSTPTDLVSTNFDSPTMINRFKILLDTVFAHIPNLDLAALNIGNESDILMGTDSNQYNAYKVFLDSVIPYAKQLYFNLHSTPLKVGTTLTHEGLVNSSTRALCKKLNKSLDIVATTYYPLNSDYSMKNPSVVSGDFKKLVLEYSDTNQPIYFAECGYASSDSCNSSEALQTQFFRNVFNAWDSNYKHIKYLTIFKSTDWSQASVNALGAYYGITNIKFLEYLRTLGVRTWDNDGTNKLAYEAILCELNARNWCVVSCNSATSIPSTEKKSTHSLFPNPTYGILTISSEETVNSISVYNNLGMLVLSSTSNRNDLSFLPKGIYHVTIEFKSGKKAQEKVVKY